MNGMRCNACGKKITKKVWNTQEPLHFMLEHSLGQFKVRGAYIMDNIFDVYFCSQKCLDKTIRKNRTLAKLEWYIGERDWERS